jgi:urease accessory protein
MRKTSAILAAALALIATPAFAHPGHALHDLGFTAGALHPVGGLDHVLAMLLVGVVAGMHGGRNLWLLPASFLALMLAGFTAGSAGLPLAASETGIALSVLALGLMTALDSRRAGVLVAAFVGLFGLFHGHAHGTEAVGAASLLAYAAGLCVTTATLHLAGIGMAATMLVGARAALGRRVAGGAALVAGLALLAGM